MIVNTAYPYMRTSAQKIKNLWDGNVINYQYKLGNTKDSFYYQVDHWEIYNPSTGSRTISFYDVDLTKVKTINLEYANGPKSNNGSCVFITSDGQTIKSIPLPASKSKKSIQISIPAGANIENCRIQLSSGISQNVLKLYTTSFD